MEKKENPGFRKILFAFSLLMIGIILVLGFLLLFSDLFAESGYSRQHLRILGGILISYGILRSIRAYNRYRYD